MGRKKHFSQKNLRMLMPYRVLFDLICHRFPPSTHLPTTDHTRINLLIYMILQKQILAIYTIYINMTLLQNRTQNKFFIKTNLYKLGIASRICVMSQGNLRMVFEQCLTFTAIRFLSPAQSSLGQTRLLEKEVILCYFIIQQIVCTKLDPIIISLLQINTTVIVR